MKKTFISMLALAAILGLVGCGSGGSGTSYTQAQQEPSKQTTVYSGGGDVDVSDVNVGENATYINNNDGTVTYVGGDVGGDLTIDATHNGTGPDSTSTAYDEANYDPTLSQDECNDLGFFYCSVENKCLNKPSAGSTCPAK